MKDFCYYLIRWTRRFIRILNHLNRYQRWRLTEVNIQQYFNERLKNVYFFAGGDKKSRIQSISFKLKLNLFILCQNREFFTSKIKEGLQIWIIIVISLTDNNGFSLRPSVTFKLRLRTQLTRFAEVRLLTEKMGEAARVLVLIRIKKILNQTDIQRSDWFQI